MVTFLSGRPHLPYTPTRTAVTTETVCNAYTPSGTFRIVQSCLSKCLWRCTRRLNCEEAWSKTAPTYPVAFGSRSRPDLRTRPARAGDWPRPGSSLSAVAEQGCTKAVALISSLPIICHALPRPGQNDIWHFSSLGRTRKQYAAILGASVARTVPSDGCTKAEQTRSTCREDPGQFLICFAARTVPETPSSAPDTRGIARILAGSVGEGNSRRSILVNPKRP